jgi:Flp pilus assembly protein TadG
VEMAVVIMLLLIIVAGIVDIGGMYVSYVAITNAAREGARYASHFPGLEDGIKQAAVQEAAGGGVVLAPANVSVVGLSSAPGETIEVRVQYVFDTMMGGLTGLGSITLRSSTKMIVFGTDDQ